MEEWRTVAEFPDYEVSTLGRLRSLKSGEAKILSGTIGTHGYTAFILRKADNPKPYRRTLHRLMAVAFLPNPLGLSDVAHQDGDPSNRALSNLRWSTHRDNQLDMRRHGTMQDGEKCCTAKLTQEQALEIILRVRAGEKQNAIAAEYRLSKAQICRIVNGSRWKSLVA
jgi:HNH endonuclease/NUMOD4 motif